MTAVVVVKTRKSAQLSLWKSLAAGKQPGVDER